MNIQQSKYVIDTIKYPKLWDLYKIETASFWVSEEIRLDNDFNYFCELSKDEQKFIKYVLAFFAQSDGIVVENLVNCFVLELNMTEALCFYGFQIAMENIHSETYSRLLNVYVQDKSERDILFNAIENIPVIGDKAAWCQKYINKSYPLVLRVLVYICVEGIFFSSSFASIFWLKQRNLKLDGLIQSNQLISRDEGLHMTFGIEVFKLLSEWNQMESEQVFSIIREAVDLEHKFVKEALSTDLVSMSQHDMCNYVEFVADRILLELGYKKIFNKDNPFMFMDAIGLQTKVNFFEKKVGDYQHPTQCEVKADIDLNQDF